MSSSCVYSLLRRFPEAAGDIINTTFTDIIALLPRVVSGGSITTLVVTTGTIIGNPHKAIGRDSCGRCGLGG
jgi:hypothetical protein